MTKPYLNEIGTTGLNRWGNDVYEEFLPNLRYPQAAKIYQEMSSNDPTLGAILYMAEELIRKVDWAVKPASDKPIDQEAALFLEQCMDDMSITWADTITEILSMLVYGWSFHEIVYKVRKGPKETNPRYRSKYTDGRVGWRKFAPRSQHTLFGWVFDDKDGGIIAMRQQSPPDYRLLDIPLSKGLLFRTKVSRDNPEGRSLLRNAYRPWYFKKRIEEIEGVGIERDLAGLPILIPPENVDIWDPQNEYASQVRTVAENLVRNVRRDRTEGVVIPNGWDFKLLSTGGSRQFDTNAIINRYDQRMAITMLADLVMLGADKVGSFALADVKKSLLGASLEAQVTSIADVINKYAVAKLFDYNYFPGITDVPKIVAGDVETPDIKEIAFLLRAAALDPAKDFELMNYLRRLASVPLIDEETFKAVYGTAENRVEGSNDPELTEQQRTDNIESYLESSDELYAGK